MSDKGLVFRIKTPTTQQEKDRWRTFPGDSMVRNPPASAGGFDQGLEDST